MVTASDLEPGGRACIADEVEAPAAYFAADRWNGWAVPYFDRAGLTQLCHALDAFADDNPDAGIIRLRLEGDEVQGLEPDGDDPTEWVDYGGPVDIDGVPHWTPGGYGWTWYRLSPDAVRRWHVSPYSLRPSSTFYAPDERVDYRGRPVFDTAADALAAFAVDHPGPLCGIRGTGTGTFLPCARTAGHDGGHVPAAH